MNRMLRQRQASEERPLPFAVWQFGVGGQGGLTATENGRPTTPNRNAERFALSASH